MDDVGGRVRRLAFVGLMVLAAVVAPIAVPIRVIRGERRRVPRKSELVVRHERAAAPRVSETV
jgi:hypothetical protein